MRLGSGDITETIVLLGAELVRASSSREAVVDVVAVAVAAAAGLLAGTKCSNATQHEMAQINHSAIQAALFMPNSRPELV